MLSLKFNGVELSATCNVVNSLKFSALNIFVRLSFFGVLND